MSFNENDVNRDNGGRFDIKTGAPADVSLESDEVTLTVEQRAGIAEALGVDEGIIEASDEMHYDHLPMVKVGDEEYAFGTEAQADAAARTYIGEHLWAQRSGDLARETGLSPDVFDALIEQSGGGEKYQDDIESIVAHLSDDGVDGYAERLIESEGRGASLSLYDGEETEVEVGDETYYLYRTN